MKFLSKEIKNLKGKTALVRIDLNIGETKNLKKHPRIKGAIQTIKFLRANDCRVVLLSHRGRIKTETDKKNLSLKPFAKVFSDILDTQVDFVDYKKISTPSVQTLSMLIKKSKKKSVFLLENTRFFNGEEKNEIQLAKRLANFGDFFVNDAFSVSHRANSSVCAITKFLPSYVGLLLERELKELSAVLQSPTKPLIVILGGAKISDKIGLINNFKNKAEKFLLGGGIANTLFAYDGLPVGDSLYEKDINLDFLKNIRKKIILPSQVNIFDRKILDISPEAVREFEKEILKAKTIIWNGPMGYFEDKRFAKGTETLKKSVLKNKTAKIIIGGGETAALFTGVNQKNIFVSSGGGAMLEFLSGVKLPGIEVLK